jgi:two-component system LytT family sensor kinase
MSQEIPKLFKVHVHTVALHGVCWVCYAAVSYYFAFINGIPFLSAHPSVYIVGQIAVFYLNFYCWVPGLLAGRKFVQFIVSNVALATGLALLLIPFYHWLRVQYLGDGHPFPLSLTTQFILRSLEFFSVCLLAAIARFSNDWFLHQKQARELENARLKTELAFLRAQINPHFLFNTLNSLYALAIKRSEQTAPAIMQLSGLMRYHLDGNEERPRSLLKELEVIENYIDLQRLRLPRNFTVDFRVDGDIGGSQLPPLLLLPLIENAFKHGADHIVILVSVNERKLTLTTENSLSTYPSGQVSGIGLVNLQKRLNFLFDGKGALGYYKSGDCFYATLEIPLTFSEK